MNAGKWTVSDQVMAGTDSSTQQVPAKQRAAASDDA